MKPSKSLTASVTWWNTPLTVPEGIFPCYRIAGKFRGRKLRDCVLKQAFRGINFAIQVCGMYISRFECAVFCDSVILFRDFAGGKRRYLVLGCCCCFLECSKGFLSSWLRVQLQHLPLKAACVATMCIRIYGVLK